MATSTKKALAAALKKMMEVKPIDKITVKDLVEICGVNRQTFYYHFDDVYDLLEWVFEEDANANLPKEVVYDRWKTDVIMWIKYLQENSTFALNVYNSNSRLYPLYQGPASGVHTQLCGYRRRGAQYREAGLRICR